MGKPALGNIRYAGRKEDSMTIQGNQSGWKLENSYAGLPEFYYTAQAPEQGKDPKLVLFNRPLAEALGFQADELEKEAERTLSGNSLPVGSKPIAQAYAGHQFGGFTMLGDGRAVLLGEQITPQGDRFDVQLKGAGHTRYSRGGDGRAALGPMLREYIISEAMHGLGIPTTRSLAVVTTGEPVYRETELEGAVLTRIAESHLRVGTFEYAAQWGSVEKLKELADYAIARHYPEAAEADNPYLAFLRGVIRRQAKLISQWQLVGFIHGVMNTDNMAISGQTIDYGPCAFMDSYDLKTVFSSIDTQGRYAYGNQPGIGGWNLARFAESLIPILDENQDRAVEMAQDAMSEYGKQFEHHWLSGMRAKLGIFTEEQGDESLIKELLALMQKYEADFTNTFRELTFQKPTSLDGKEGFAAWQEKWKARLERQSESAEQVKKLMMDSNPAVIPRNHRVEEAIEAAVNEGNYEVLKRLLAVLANPYAHTPDQLPYTTPPGPESCNYQTFCGT